MNDDILKFYSRILLATKPRTKLRRDLLHGLDQIARVVRDREGEGSNAYERLRSVLRKKRRNSDYYLTLLHTTKQILESLEEEKTRYIA